MTLPALSPACAALNKDLLASLSAKPEPCNVEDDKLAAKELCDMAEAHKLERELQRLCECELHKRGITYQHLSPRAREKIGWPDLVFPHPLDGRFCAVELKSARGKATKEQEETMEDLRRCKAIVRLVRTFGEFVEVLEKGGSDEPA